MLGDGREQLLLRLRAVLPVNEVGDVFVKGKG